MTLNDKINDKSDTPLNVKARALRAPIERMSYFCKFHIRDTPKTSMSISEIVLRFNSCLI